MSTPEVHIGMLLVLLPFERRTCFTECMNDASISSLQPCATKAAALLHLH